MTDPVDDEPLPLRPRTIRLSGPPPAPAVSRARSTDAPPAPAIDLGPPLEDLADPTGDPPTATTPVATVSGQLVRSNVLVASGTLLSRLTGLIRTGLVFTLLSKALADAYLLANNTPNIIYELILGGILTATLVPLFTDDLENGDGSSTSAVVSFVIVVLVGLAALTALLSPGLMWLYARGSPADSRADFLGIGVRFAVLFAPQVFFYGLMALWSAVLNARHRFFAAAWAPVLNNLVVIGVLVATWRAVDGKPTIADLEHRSALLILLGLGTTAGIAAMTLSLWPALRRAGVDLRFRFEPRHPAVRRAARLSSWTLGYVIANQVAVQVVSILAKPGTGGVQNYQTAFQFFQLPHGLLAVSIMTTFLPDLSAFAARRDLAGFRDRFGLGSRLLILVILPAAVGYVLLARPVIAALLERGAFGDASGDLTAEVLAAMALGLVGFSVYLFVLRGFYALKDTRTPFLVNLFENAVNIALAFALVGRFGVQGLALAYAGAYSIAAVVAVVLLRRRIGGMDGRRTLPALAKIAVAAAVMGVAVVVARELVGSNAGLGAVARTVAGVVVGAAVYLGALYALRLPELHELVGRFRGRGARRAASASG